MRFEADVAEVSEHTGFNVTGHLVGLDIHGSGVDPDFRIGLLVHRFVRSGVVGYLRAQILRGQGGVHARVIGAVSHDLPLILLEALRIVADALDEQNAITELAGEVVVNLRALRPRYQHGV